MYYPSLDEDYNARTLISTWLGYNHNYLTTAGEFYDMENLSSNSYPLMSPRSVRPLLVKGTNFRGIAKMNGNVYYLLGNVLHHNDISLDLSAYMDTGDKWQTILTFGAYLLFFPANIYVNIFDSTDIGTLSASYISGIGKTVTYSICDINGDDYGNATAS